MGVPYTFGTATTSIPLSQLDANFNTPVTLGNTTVGLGNTATTIGNLTLTNVTITSGTINAAVVDSGYVANSIVYADSSGVLTAGSANLVFTGTNVGIGTSSPTFTAGGGLQISNATQANLRLSDTTNAAYNFDLFMNDADAYAVNRTSGPIVFGTNNTERMRIDSSGSVGINATTNLRGNLEVRRASLSAFTGTSLGNIVVSDSAATADYFVPIDFAVIPTTGTPPIARIAAQRTGSGSYLYFGTSSNYSSGITNSAMVIDYVGNVGINVTSPVTRLDVNGIVTIRNNGGTFNTTPNTNYGLNFQAANSGVTYITSYSSGGSTDIAFATNSGGGAASERMRINSSGNVGIGTSSPSTTLDVTSSVGTVRVSSTTTTSTAYFTATNAAGNFYIGRDSSTGGNFGTAYAAVLFSEGAYPMTFYTTSLERMRITSTGNVGIGTTSPGAKLDVIGTTFFRGTVGGRTLSISEGSTSTIGFLIEADTNAGDITLSSAYSAGLIAFKTAGSERMRITSSGDLLVGTTTSQGEKATFQSATISSANIGIVQIRSTKTSDSGDCALAIVKNANDSTTAQVFVRFGINGYASGSGQINANGASAAAFGSFSDIRLKENITDLPSQLANITALRPVEFDYKDGSGHQIGFIAQEMQKVYPDVVSESNDGMLMVTGWSKTEARLVKAIQEQQAMIVELTNRIKKLEGA